MWPVRAVKAHKVKAPGDRGGFLFKQFDKFFSVEKIKKIRLDFSSREDAYFTISEYSFSKAFLLYASPGSNI